jgi:hypothetical protein
MGDLGDSLVRDLLTAKWAIVAGWIVLALVVEQWRPAAPPPIHLAGYGAAWFKRWGRNFGFFILNAALSSLFVLPVTIWAALHAPWSRPELRPLRLGPLPLDPAARVLDLLVAPRQPRVAVRGVTRCITATGIRRHHRAALPFRRGGAGGVRLVIMAFAIPLTSVAVEILRSATVPSRHRRSRRRTWRSSSRRRHLASPPVRAIPI